MYAANLLFWRRYRVNYPFIFGFKRGTELGYREVLLLSTGILVLALAGFLANWHLDMDSSTQNYKTVTELVPLGLLTVRFYISTSMNIFLGILLVLYYNNSVLLSKWHIQCINVLHCLCSSFWSLLSVLLTSYTDQVVSSLFEGYSASYVLLSIR